jgi:hypothetical protein
MKPHPTQALRKTAADMPISACGGLPGGARLGYVESPVEIEDESCACANTMI